jgi:hypothetical protein
LTERTGKSRSRPWINVILSSVKLLIQPRCRVLLFGSSFKAVPSLDDFHLAFIDTELLRRSLTKILSSRLFSWGDCRAFVRRVELELIDVEAAESRDTVDVGLSASTFSTLLKLLSSPLFACLLGNDRLKDNFITTFSTPNAANILTFQVGLSDDPVDRFLLSTGRTASSLRIPEDCTV